MTDWEEVKRLAADFQKVQLGSSAQRLSERNCIEIISWLREKKMIELIFTTDGKDCLTPDQLLRDMQDEIYASGGRIELVDLAKNIGVDLSHINNQLNSLLRHQKSLNLVVGQLIDSTYVNKIVIEINEKLTSQGQINVNDLSIHYNLPGEFLQGILEKNLNKSLIGKQDKNDPKVFFTEFFIAKNLAKIRGGLFGLTKPTPVASILSHIDVAEKLFFSLFDQATACGSLTSRLAGAQYIPDIHAKSVHKWIADFFSQNSYLEYDTLKKLGVSDYESYVKKQFQSENIIYLDSCLISIEIMGRLLDEIEDCIATKSFVDVPSIVPSVFNEKDTLALVKKTMTPQRMQQISVLGTFVVSVAFIDNLIELCKDLTEDKAKKCVESGAYQEYKMKLLMGAPQRSQKQNDSEETSGKREETSGKREERRKKAAAGKAGGGAQGRETKTKSTKKTKGNSKDEDTTVVDNSGKKQTLEILTKEDILSCIEDHVNDNGLDQILEAIVDNILEKLNVEALKIADNIYATTVVDQTANRRQTHNQLQQKINDSLGDIRLYEKGIKLVPVDLQTELYKYLLKSICTDVVNEILGYQAQENNMTVPLTNNDQRLKFVNRLPEGTSNLLRPLAQSLTSTNIESFMTHIDGALGACSMIIKKIDKKKDRMIVLNRKHELLEQLNKCYDLPIVLHLAVVVIFTTATQCMLYVSGRHLQQVLMFLKQYLNSEQIEQLMTYHDYVGSMLTDGSDKESLKQKLEEMVPSIKKIANEFKKPAAEKS